MLAFPFWLGPRMSAFRVQGLIRVHSLRGIMEQLQGEYNMQAPSTNQDMNRTAQNPTP